MSYMQDNSDDYTWLDKLLQESDSNDVADLFKRPSDTIIEAYISNDCTDDDKNEMIKSMSLSKSFRMEMIEKINHYDTFTSSETHQKIYKSNITSIYKYTSLLAAAAMIVFIIVSLPNYYSNTPIQLSLMSEQLEKDLLISNDSNRLIFSDTSTSFLTSQEAALDEFRNMLVFKDGQFLKNQKYEITPIESNSQEIKIEVTDTITSKVQNLKMNIPNDMNLGTDELQIWVLTMPDRTLYKSLITSKAITFKSSLSTNDFICITLVNKSDSTYKVSSGLIIYSK